MSQDAYAITTSPEDGSLSLMKRLQRAERHRKLKALLLIAPLALFLLISFVMPISSLLTRSIDNSEVPTSLPNTVTAIQQWDQQDLPDERVFQALAQDLLAIKSTKGNIGQAAKRLNYDITGFRSLLMKTYRKLPADPIDNSWQTTFTKLSKKWAEPRYWHAIHRASSPYTSFYLLAALDKRVNDAGEIISVPETKALYIDVFQRTFWMGAVITLFCLLLGYPVAYLLANLPAKTGNLLMILVLLPFWTSLLVRTASWIVLLQSGGLINSALLGIGFIDEPLQLVFNRFGVYVAMVHIMLPFMILPLYSVMKGIPPSYMRAAVSLGAHPWIAFFRVYVPQTMAGVGAGVLLVYIISIGYYITPALIGSPQDQMVSYFIAFFTNNTLKWGMASALGALLLVATMILYAAYHRIVGSDNMKLG